MISAPLRSRASTTTVAAQSPAMIRFRAGNLQGAGSTPGAYSDDREPGRANPSRELGVRRRVVAVDPAAEHRHGRPAGFERATVGLAVDPAGKAADDHEPGRGQLPAEHSRDLRAVGRARASADDADRGPRRGARSRRGPRTKRPAGGSWIARRSSGKARVRSRQPPDPLRLQPGEIAGLVERAREGPIGGVARLANEVRATLGRQTPPARAPSCRPELASASGRRAPPQGARRQPRAWRRARRSSRRPGANEPAPARRAAGARQRGRAARSPPSTTAGARTRSTRAPTRPARAPAPRPRWARRRARPRVDAASRRRGRTGRGAPARACRGTPRAAVASTCTRPRDRRAPRRDRGSSRRRAGSAPERRPCLRRARSRRCRPRAAGEAPRAPAAGTRRTRRARALPGGRG